MCRHPRSGESVESIVGVFDDGGRVVCQPRKLRARRMNLPEIGRERNQVASEKLLPIQIRDHKQCAYRYRNKTLSTRTVYKVQRENSTPTAFW